MEQVITFSELARIIKRHLVLILLSVVCVTVLVAIYTFTIANQEYEASSQLIIIPQEASEDMSEDQANNQLTRLINTSKDIIQNPVILSSVRQELDEQRNSSISLSDLQKKVNVSNTANSQLLVVNVTDTSAKRAAETANLIAQRFKSQAKLILNLDNVLITKASIPESSSSPNRENNLIFGVAFGVFVGLVLTFFMEILDHRVKDSNFITEKLGLKIIANISHF